MDDLLDFVLEAHGALRRWPGVNALIAKLAVSWPFWSSSGSPGYPCLARRGHRGLGPPPRPGLRGRTAGLGKLRWSASALIAFAAGFAASIPFSDTTAGYDFAASHPAFKDVAGYFAFGPLH